MARHAADVPSTLPRVHLLATGGTIAGAQTAATTRGYKAAALSVVLAGVGDGNVGAAALAAAAEAAGAGVAVVRSSRTGGGVVERNIEIDDDRLGFIAADELNPQKARVLLMLGLARTRDPAALQAMFYAY